MQASADTKCWWVVCPVFCNAAWRLFVYGVVGLIAAGFSLDLVWYHSCGCGGMQANESNAVAALKEYGSAQYEIKKAGYANGNYATETDTFSTNALLPMVFINAIGPAGIGKEYQGYRFAFVYFRNGTVIDFKTEMPGLCAWPARYAQDGSGVNTYVIDGSGQVLMKDNYGKPVRDMAEVDTTWVVP